MNNIIGIWHSDQLDAVTQKKVGMVIIEFKFDGELIYTIFENDKMQKIYMSYEILDNIIISNQPSSPQRIETNFRILSDDKLELTFDNVSTKYIRMS
jgi:hypothetical protein